MCGYGDAAGVVWEDRRLYGPEPASVSGARRQVREMLGVWGYGRLVEETELVAAELSGNAVLHGCAAGEGFGLRLAVTAGGGLRVEVSDPCGERWPQPQVMSAERDSGRGLIIVGHLARRWGVTCHPRGKIVWSELRLPR